MATGQGMAMATGQGVAMATGQGVSRALPLYRIVASWPLYPYYTTRVCTTRVHASQLGVPARGPVRSPKGLEGPQDPIPGLRLDLALEAL